MVLKAPENLIFCNLGPKGNIGQFKEKSHSNGNMYLGNISVIVHI